MTMCTTMPNVTSRQADVVRMIRQYRRANGFQPTLVEIAKALGTSKVTAMEHLDKLERKGVLKRDKYKARMYTLTRLADELVPDEAPATKLPVLANVMAGRPIEHVDHAADLDLASIFKARKGVYTLRIKGDGFAAEHICDGDVIVIERRDKARNGEQVVAAFDDGNTTIGRFYKDGEYKVRIVPAGGGKHIVTDDGRVRIAGVVTGVLRSDSL